MTSCSAYMYVLHAMPVWCHYVNRCSAVCSWSHRLIKVYRQLSVYKPCRLIALVHRSSWSAAAAALRRGAEAITARSVILKLVAGQSSPVHSCSADRYIRQVHFGYGTSPPGRPLGHFPRLSLLKRKKSLDNPISNPKSISQMSPLHFLWPGPTSWPANRKQNDGQMSTAPILQTL